MKVGKKQEETNEIVVEAALLNHVPVYRFTVPPLNRLKILLYDSLPMACFTFELC